MEARTLWWCVWLSAASILSAQAQDNLHQKGCTLKPSMELAHCIAPHQLEGAVEQELYSQSDETQLAQRQKSVVCKSDDPAGCGRDTNTFSRLGADGEQEVMHGTGCALDPNIAFSPIFKCRAGVWIKLGTLNDQTQSVTFDSGYGRLRKKRSYVDIPEQRCGESCSGWWFWWSCSWSCWTNYRRNYLPEIYCPVIPDQVAESEMDTKIVRWKPANATDPEDGPLRVRQTTGPQSGTALTENTYVVSYEAKDNAGYAVYCNITFRVQVLKCPTSSVNTCSIYYIPNGNTSCTSHNLYGSTCSYRCYGNYQISGSDATTCLYDGTWSEEKPRCVLNCLAPARVHQGAYDGCGPEYVVGTTCGLLCNSGYRPSGTKYITCQTTGQWSTYGSCLGKV
ncbi:E-selectin-like [Physella acuta]|uniref:E-selectin-like n=1 Tax=Physella acuta TaxID=109671 RepID=UPI0027DBE54E|nr:E-selectin-like [Physella acuta]